MTRVMRMRMPRILISIIAGCSALAAPSFAQEASDCLRCHGKPGLKMEVGGRDVSLSVDRARFEKSVHASLDCVSCHTQLEGVEQYPHPAGLAPVACGEC